MARAGAGLTIGGLAAESGVNLETIRYYERIGLMPEPGRTPAGHRLYAPEHRRRLAFIRRARGLGFTLQTIQGLLDMAGPGARCCASVRSVTAAHLAEVRTKMAELARLEAILAEALSRCAPETAASCAVLDMLEADETRRRPSGGSLDLRVRA